MWVHGKQGDVGAEVVDMEPMGYPAGTFRIVLTLYRKGRSMSLHLSPSEARALVEGLAPQVRWTEAARKDSGAS